MKTKSLLFLVLVGFLFTHTVVAQENTLYEYFTVPESTTETTVYSSSWPESLPNQMVCSVFDFEGFPSRLIVESGWFIGDQIYGEFNGESFTIGFEDSGELAKQIKGFGFDNPSNLKICTVRNDYGTEIGLRLRVIPEEIYKYKIFLPVIFTSTPTLYEEREITKDFETIQVGFPGALPTQKTCVIYKWPSGTESLYVESGWFIGDLSSFSITLNGSPVSYTATQSGIAYNFEVKKTFTNPQGPLEICTSRASGGGNEIGFRGGVQ